MSNKDYEPNHGQDIDEDAAELSDQDIPAHLLEGEEEAAGGANTETLQAEVNALNDKILRLAAELENTRKRAEREKGEIGRYAIANFARDLLSVADNFERALSAAPDEGSEASAETVSGLVTGVRMTEKELLKTLERHGVQKLDPAGEKFDPNLHQAVAQAPAPGVPAGFIAQTAQTGFVLGDRVLRAAMVIVSTGEPDGPGAGDDQAEPGSRLDTRA